MNSSSFKSDSVVVEVPSFIVGEREKMTSSPSCIVVVVVVENDVSRECSSSVGMEGAVGSGTFRPLSV